MWKNLACLIASQVFATAISSSLVFYPNGSFAPAVEGYPGLDTVLLEEATIDAASPPAKGSENPSGVIVVGAITVSTDNTNVSLQAVKEIKQMGWDFYRSRTGDIAGEVDSGQPIFPPITFGGVRVSQYLVNPRPRTGNTRWIELRANLHVVLRRYRLSLPDRVRLTTGGDFFTTTQRTDSEGEKVNEIMSLITVHRVSQYEPSLESTLTPQLAAS